MHFATADEMARLDSLVVKNGLEIRQMMELAGWHILSIFKKLKIKRQSWVLVAVGKGNKGGDGLCAARHLINHGFFVYTVLLSEDLSPDARHQLNLLKKVNENKYVYNFEEEDEDFLQELLIEADIVIDALIGYRLDGAPRGNYEKVVNLINKSGCKIISYDIPTGIDSTTGECFDPCINADATLTLALPKKAFENTGTKEKSGKMFLGDIGIPGFLYDKLEKGSRPNFGGKGVVPL